ncbi:MAG: hypothetical protein KC414_13905 [Romboutsia sp.]|nr:hypothetical protein [Romboutsia sp.]
MKQLKSVKDRTKYMLTNYPKLRNSDSKLVANFWYNQLKEQGINLTDISSTELLQMFSSNKLSSYESISRCRRKLQENFTELRGTNYSNKKEEEEYTKQHINQDL